MFSHPLLIR